MDKIDQIAAFSPSLANSAMPTPCEIPSDELTKSHIQIAHDLRSPISALNFVLSMNKSMPESSQNLLKMAIERLNSIANKLNP